MTHNHTYCQANGYTYTVFGSAQFDDRAGLGYTGGNFSTDGQYVVGDLGNSDLCDSCDLELAKPSYVAAEKYPNWPHLNHDEALELVGFAASSDGSSDGWYFYESLG